MVGTQTPQKLFGDIPAENAQIPGMVTPQTTAAMPNNVDLAGILDALNKQKEISSNAWARAAAINNARGGGQPQQGVDLPGTASQSSGMGAQYRGTAGGGSPSVMWAPRNLQGAQLGTWASQQQNRATAENREIPMVLQAHTGDPFSPGEVGGGTTSSRGLYGPGLTSPMGTPNPAMWQRMWANKLSGGVGGGGGGDGYSGNPFPTQSLRERTSPGPQYQYDALYRG
jgi:hypothetical protein